MTNWRPDDPALYEDVQTRWQYEHVALKKTPEERLKRLWRSSRDSARTPMQWSDAEHAGFSTAEPWFSVNPNYREINVARQEKDPDSLLNFYRRAIELRKSLPVVRHGSYKELLHRSKRLYAYERESKGTRLLVICSFSEQPMKLPKRLHPGKASLILCNYTAKPDTDTLRPYEARVYLMV